MLASIVDVRPKLCHMAGGRQHCGALAISSASAELHAPCTCIRGAGTAGAARGRLVSARARSFVMLCYARGNVRVYGDSQGHYCRVSFLGFPVDLEGRAHSVGSVFVSSTKVPRAVEACELVGGGHVEVVTRP